MGGETCTKWIQWYTSVEIADVDIEHNFKYFKPIVFLPGNLANCYFINECKKINGKRYYLFLTLLQGLNPLSLVRCLSGSLQ
jgi:hypothetical protein